MGDRTTCRAIHDARCGFADADQAGGHDGVRAEGAAGRIEGSAVVQADGAPQDELFVGELGVQFGDVDWALVGSGVSGGERGGRRAGKIASAKGMGIDAMVDSGDPGRALADPSREIACGEDNGGGASLRWASAVAELVVDPAAAELAVDPAASATPHARRRHRNGAAARPSRA